MSLQHAKILIKKRRPLHEENHLSSISVAPNTPGTRAMNLVEVKLNCPFPTQKNQSGDHVHDQYPSIGWSTQRSILDTWLNNHPEVDRIRDVQTYSHFCGDILEISIFYLQDYIYIPHNMLIPSNT